MYDITLFNRIGTVVKGSYKHKLANDVLVRKGEDPLLRVKIDLILTLLMPFFIGQYKIQIEHIFLEDIAYTVHFFLKPQRR